MSQTLVAPPTRVPAVDQQRFFTREWRNYLLVLQNTASATPQILQEVALQGQSASITTTPITLPAVSSGFYRISIYQTVTAAAGVSSSLTTTIGWTDNGVAKTFSLPVMNGNATTTNDALDRMIHIDNASPVTYATAYASNPANAMNYALGIIVEKM